MSKEKKSLFLANLFKHLDGIVLIPTIIELEKKKILSNFKDCSLSELTNRYKANEAYLNVALRLLCSQGLLDQNIHDDNEVYFKKSPKLINFKTIISTYKIAIDLYNHKISPKEVTE